MLRLIQRIGFLVNVFFQKLLTNILILRASSYCQVFSVLDLDCFRPLKSVTIQNCRTNSKDFRDMKLGDNSSKTIGCH